MTRFSEAENIQIIAEYVEAETGKGADALAHHAAPEYALTFSDLNNLQIADLISVFLKKKGLD